MGIVRDHSASSSKTIPWNDPLAKLQPQAIRAFYDEKKSTGLSDRSVQYMHTVLNAALKQAVLDEIIEKNPCTVASVRIKKPQRTKEINVLSQEQVNKLLAAATDWRKIIFFIAWGTGLRREELLGLRWQDIDFKQGTLSVNTTVICTKAFGSMINKPKNTSSYRTIPISKEILHDLQKYRVVVKSEQLSSLNYENNDLVFARKDGKPHDPRRLSKDFKKFIISAGLPEKFHLHDLRHTHATQLLQLGVHPKVVQYRLGHSTFQQTMDTYSHVFPQMQDGIADMMSAMLPNKKQS
nr:site-specific integrase [Propionispira raffinosivorans]